MGGELKRWVGHFLKCDHDVVELENFQTLIGVDFYIFQMQNYLFMLAFEQMCMFALLD